MANLAVAHENLADAAAGATVSASDAELLMPITLVQDPHVSRRYRSISTTPFIIVDLGATVYIDTIMLRGMTLTLSATIRVRVSSVDPTGLAGDIADSGVLSDETSAWFDPHYGALVYLVPAPDQARYVRFDFSDPTASYVEIGRLFVGVREEFEINYAPGASITWVDRSVAAETRGGQTLFYNDNSYRMLDLSIEWVTQTQAHGVVETMDRVNGRHVDVLFITDPDSTNLARDSIWGLMSELTPVAVLNLFGSGGEMFSKAYRIKERL